MSLSLAPDMRTFVSGACDASAKVSSLNIVNEISQLTKNNITLKMPNTTSQNADYTGHAENFCIGHVMLQQSKFSKHFLAGIIAQG